jgi:hypothetical protein
MDQTGQRPPPKSEPKLIDAIIEAAKKAFTPGADEAAKTEGLQEYQNVIDKYVMKANEDPRLARNTKLTMP